MASMGERMHRLRPCSSMCAASAGRRQDGPRRFGPARADQASKIPRIAAPQLESTGPVPARRTNPCTRSGCVVSRRAGGQRVNARPAEAAHHKRPRCRRWRSRHRAWSRSIAVAPAPRRGQQSAPARRAGADVDDADAAALRVLDHGQQPGGVGLAEDEVGSSVIKSLAFMEAPWRSQRAAAAQSAAWRLGIGSMTPAASNGPRPRHAAVRGR